MPEGHTLRRLAGHLDEAFAGRPVRASSPQGRFEVEARQIDGAVLVGADSIGKQLFVEFSGERFVHVHLGLIGGWEVTTGVEEVPPPVGAVRLRLATATAYADLRGATRCDLVGPETVERVRAQLGPDPLRPEDDVERAWAKVRVSSRTIGDLLMDQTVLAGVGNVYRAEVLFRHRIDPLRQGRQVTRAQFVALWDDLVVLMNEGVATGRIDTVRPEHTPEAMGRPPRKDDHGGEVYVYRRTAMPCLVCGTPVSSSTLGGRNLFWCSKCQRAPRRRD
ncbi:Fpg/Nei family DNA glycosylase [Nocardioides daphniae]|uniref:DNA-(apurinic or apyrimidinic site) lyase n=1 Tax=Nocardioides daphniae TaxID=402297 RepID=A0A4P7UBZ3_9ACTN|nr:DNA-formamidopyrimidine glycosylase family protein [Nocardioides daphniae]QCC76798.1 Fpg/Nei family DNA glycosylase [Nocardioides daphniae]GGD16594.1 endonuclease VIII [Nocardioides daphniae]